VPFWTKRNPDYGSKMKTINCRDDSLLDDRGMWTTMKRSKRCIVVAQGFYEWLKKGSQKIPHFTRRKDGQLMCLAGLWDMVQFEGECIAPPLAAHGATRWPVMDRRSCIVCWRASRARFPTRVPRFPCLVRLPWTY
jgi:putative SOS response-associated peptidase YedK